MAWQKQTEPACCLQSVSMDCNHDLIKEIRCSKACGRSGPPPSI